MDHFRCDEKLRKELSEIVRKRADAAEKLAVIERQIYAYEGSYLEDTSAHGNVVEGWDSFLTTFSSPRDESHRFVGSKSKPKKKVRETDRLFSNSSISSSAAVCSVNEESFYCNYGLGLETETPSSFTLKRKPVAVSVEPKLASTSTRKRRARVIQSESEVEMDKKSPSLKKEKDLNEDDSQPETEEKEETNLNEFIESYYPSRKKHNKNKKVKKETKYEKTVQERQRDTETE